MSAVATLLSSRAADCHAVELYRRHAYANRHALPFFAAGAHAFVELEIVAHHRDVLERLGSVANQRGVAHWSGDLAVFNEVGFGRGEDELAAGDVDRAATEIHRIQATLYAADDVFGSVFASQHVGVRHARHGNLLIAFAPAVAGVRHIHQARRELVAEVGLEDAVFDQHRFLR